MRFVLLGLRAQLNTLISSLRDEADNMDKVRDSVKGSASLVKQLGGAAGAARARADGPRAAWLGSRWP